MSVPCLKFVHFSEFVDNKYFALCIPPVFCCILILKRDIFIHILYRLFCTRMWGPGASSRRLWAQHTQNKNFGNISIASSTCLCWLLWEETGETHQAQRELENSCTQTWGRNQTPNLEVLTATLLCCQMINHCLYFLFTVYSMSCLQSWYFCLCVVSWMIRKIYTGIRLWHLN